MDLFTVEFFSALLAIILIDLVLAGDNAVVIALAARNLPKQHQKRAIIWGTFGAIFIRAIATIFVVWLLKVPGLLLVGGVVLIWIAYKLLTEDEEVDVKAGGSLWAAIKTIIIADAMMGLDNVLAVAGAAHGSILLVVIGLLISIPIIVFGSQLVLKLMERFPIIITLGGAVLAWTASKMIVKEPIIAQFFTNEFLKYGFEAIVVIAVIGLGYLKKKSIESTQVTGQA
ncbi:TerC family protein [Piscibacillus halophilus]|uniref:Integral membrane protein, YjbE family n=1 Tax=Piscibacillus halophilus TaxID=571933 RepID=A0A1H9JKK1_9BACI|nr:TerC family protein [Piscibacillus halophilus]SEQ87521.1 integral membrane protein, YjbE family [Piscibacillus halophilus]